MHQRTEYSRSFITYVKEEIAYFSRKDEFKRIGPICYMSAMSRVLQGYQLLLAKHRTDIWRCLSNQSDFDIFIDASRNRTKDTIEGKDNLFYIIYYRTFQNKNYYIQVDLKVAKPMNRIV